MAQRTFTGSEEALLHMINASRTSRRTLEDLIADRGCEPDEESMEAMAQAKADEEAAMAWLEANATKCPGCRQAFTFQRQAKKPNRCSWCGYDHDSGEMPGLVPA